MSSRYILRLAHMTSKDDLTESQLATLSSLADLTDGGDEPAMIGVLNSVDWDLQVRFLAYEFTYNSFFLARSVLDI